VLTLAGSPALPTWAPPTGGGISIPIGGIIMWESPTIIPSGFMICDGLTQRPVPLGGYTPDLRNKFIISAGTSFPVGSTGGSDLITTTQMPSHNHEYFFGGGGGGSGNVGNNDTGFPTPNQNFNHNYTEVTPAYNTQQPYYPPYYALIFIQRTS
jgi:hypothetical protein